MSSVFSTSFFPKRKTKTRTYMQNPDDKMAQLKSLPCRKENNTHQVLQLVSLKKKINQYIWVAGYWFGYNLSHNHLHVQEGRFPPTLENAKPSPTPSLELHSAGDGAGCPAQIWAGTGLWDVPHLRGAVSQGTLTLPVPPLQSPIPNPRHDLQRSLIFWFSISLSPSPHPPTTFWLTSHFKSVNEKKTTTLYTDSVKNPL